MNSISIIIPVLNEDNILISELYKRKQFTVINKKLFTSARRFESKGICFDRPLGLRMR